MRRYNNDTKVGHHVNEVYSWYGKYVEVNMAELAH
jgi:hypothetical protein